MTQVRLAKPADLTSAEWAKWDAIGAANPLLESPYFCSEFTRSVARVRNDVEVAVLSEGDQVVGFFPFQRATCNVGRPVGGKLNDFQGPIASQQTKLDLAKLVRQCRLACWDFEHLVMPSGVAPTKCCTTIASPYLDLSQGFDAYAAQRKVAGSDIIPKAASRQRKFERELGPLEFEYDATHDTKACETLIGWKSKQLRETGFADLFQMPWTRNLIFDLAKHNTESFGGQFSVLRHQGRPVASAFWMRGRNVAHMWFIGYDPEFATYSPGTIMLIQLFRAAAERGITRVHLGAGSERYKLSLASSAVDVCVGSIEFTHPITLARRAWRTCRDRLSTMKSGWLGGQVAAWLQPMRQWWAYR